MPAGVRSGGGNSALCHNLEILFRPLHVLSANGAFVGKVSEVTKLFGTYFVCLGSNLTPPMSRSRRRKTHSKWLFAMAASALPTRGHSFASSSSSSCSSAATFPLHSTASSLPPALETVRQPLRTKDTLEMDLQVLPSRMFLKSRHLPNMLSCETRYGGRATGTTPPGLDDDDDIAFASDLDREILGFDVTSSILHMARASSVDRNTWNVDDTSRSPIKKNSVPSSIFRKTNIPAWLPWIPTRAQIETLKVMELRQACGERSLTKSGRKADLQERLWDWAQQQHRQRVAERRTKPQWNMGMPLSHAFSANTVRSGTAKNPSARPTQKRSTQATDKDKNTSLGKNDSQPRLKANSLAEWARNVDVEPLRNRREAIRRDKDKPKKLPPRPKKIPKPLDYRSYLQKAFDASLSQYSNRDVKQLYHASKLADQAGDRDAAKTLLQTLLQATPQDARLYRRLARMQSEEGHADEARATLQSGLRLLPQNGFLWHGLGQLEHTIGSLDAARRCYQEAIRVDPQLPHSYHALGTLEHMQGRIAVAKRVFKEGIEYSPKNHRLHHALGDLYREAKMLDSAERSYRRALDLSPPVSRSFACTALACVAYERDRVEECRAWLRQSVSSNDGRHSQGWVALAQMEEAEGNIDAARGICVGAISNYERGLVHRRGRFQKRWTAAAAGACSPLDGMASDQQPALASLEDLLARKEDLFKIVPQYRSGDKFIHVFRNLARLEETHGSPDTVDGVYARAMFAFPYDWKLTVSWAQYYVRHSLPEKARSLFAQACLRAKNRHADPYRLYAEYEMSFGNFKEARKMLFRGAQAMSSCSDGGLGSRSGLSELYHSWAVCEWHLGNLGQAEMLLDDALRLTESGDAGAMPRSLILFSIARLQYDRGEHELSQHFVALCLKENASLDESSKIWDLWAHIAAAMGNHLLEGHCQEKARSLEVEDDKSDMSAFGRLLRQSEPSTCDLSVIVGAATQPLMRRNPWHDKLFGAKSRGPPGLPSTANLPSMNPTQGA